ncbi:MAG TPA: hypothetical protein VES93_05300 [Ornithinibacter sp.]|nr:hypothetical protein [Ornithinibacter sp.]
MDGIGVTPQVPIVDERGECLARVDFLVDGTTVILEFDGKVKYAAGDPKVLWGEKRREDRLRGSATLWSRSPRRSSSGRERLLRRCALPRPAAEPVGANSAPEPPPPHRE